MAAAPVYFESSWAVLSSIGLVNAINGLLVVGITGISPIAFVPVTVSLAAAIANGLCYYSFYAHYNLRSTVAAAACADIFWLIQEAGLSFYSYIILNRILSSRARIVFLWLFWTGMMMILAIRLAILVCRQRDLLHNDSNFAEIVSRLHIGYFVLIAIVEIISAYFLLRKFAAAKKRCDVLGWSRFPGYLTQSTELRLATLALIGTTRAITYSFQRTQKATSVTGQLDRFVFTLECMFPMVMYIDMLATRVVGSSQGNGSFSSSKLPPGTANTIEIIDTQRMRTRIASLDPMSISFEKLGTEFEADNVRKKNKAGGVDLESDAGFEAEGHVIRIERLEPGG